MEFLFHVTRLAHRHDAMHRINPHALQVYRGLLFCATELQGGKKEMWACFSKAEHVQKAGPPQTDESADKVRTEPTHLSW